MQPHNLAHFPLSLTSSAEQSGSLVSLFLQYVQILTTYLWELWVGFVDGMWGGIDSVGKLLLKKAIDLSSFTDPNDDIQGR